MGIGTLDPNNSSNSSSRFPSGQNLVAGQWYRAARSSTQFQKLRKIIVDVNVARLLEFTLDNSAMDDARRVYFDDFVIIFSLVRVEESKWYVGD